MDVVELDVVVDDVAVDMEDDSDGLLGGPRLKGGGLLEDVVVDLAAVWIWERDIR